MSRKSTMLLSTVFILGGIFVWGLQYLPISTQASSRLEEIKAKLLTIPTPVGWYAWGMTIFPTDPISTKTSADVSFSNHELNDNSQSATSEILTIHGDSLGVRTPEQWIDYRKIYGSDGSLQSATSTDRTWGMENGRLVVSVVTTTMGGSHILSYYLFDGGIVYQFMLSPAFAVPDIINSPNAQLLRDMVKQFADSLPNVATSSPTK
ncbi:MAG: hypothetical protein ACYC1Y_01305 [Minisyncoccota bacterium]